VPEVAEREAVEPVDSEVMAPEMPDPDAEAADPEAAPVSPDPDAESGGEDVDDEAFHEAAE